MKATPAAKAAKRRSLIKRGFEVLQEDGMKTLSRKIRGMTNIANTVGYSSAGIVMAVGKDVTGFSPGDRVACAGAGYACHAEWIRVPPMLASRVPDGVSLKDACWTTIGAIALQGIRRAAPQLGEVVVVTGLGLLGQLTVQFLRAAGCQCIALDLDPRRIEKAIELGATIGLDARDQDAVREQVERLPNGIGADAVLLCATSSSDEPMAQALQLVRQRGRVVVVGDIGMKLPRSPFYQKEAEVTISCSYGPGRYDSTYEEGGLDYPPGFVRWTENRNMGAFLHMLDNGSVQLEGLNTHAFSIEEGGEAYQTLVQPDANALGVLLRYPVTDSPDKTPDETRIMPVHDPVQSPIQVAMIGLGGFAMNYHLPNLESHPDFALRYAVSRTGATATREAKSFHAAFAATDWREVLEDQELHAVVICTRHDSHAEIAAAALRAGKHVLVEKPIGLTEAEIDDVLKAQKESGKVLLVGHNRRFSPGAQKLAKALREINSPAMIQMRINAGNIPPSHWTQDPEVGGGRIIGEVCHFIDLSAALLGDVGFSVSAATGIPTDYRDSHRRKPRAHPHRIRPCCHCRFQPRCRHFHRRRSWAHPLGSPR